VGRLRTFVAQTVTISEQKVSLKSGSLKLTSTPQLKIFPTPRLRLHSPAHKLGIPVEMVQFLFKLLLKNRILALYHDFH